VKDQVFICYSHEDDKWRDELETHVKPLVRNGSVTTWSDQRIRPGSEWEPAIDAVLKNTRIAVLLVSRDFFNSDFIYHNELGPLLKRAEEGGVKILWIPIGHSSYEETPLKKYQALSDPEKPLAVIPRARRDKVWVEICRKTKNEVGAMAAAPNLPVQSPELEHNQEMEPIPSFHASEPQLAPTAIAETTAPDPASFSSGQRAMANAAARVAAETQHQNAQADALAQQRLSRETTRKASWEIIRRIFDGL
jgi:hypothetical protein